MNSALQGLIATVPFAELTQSIKIDETLAPLQHVMNVLTSPKTTLDKGATVALNKIADILAKADETLKRGRQSDSFLALTVILSELAKEYQSIRSNITNDPVPIFDSIFSIVTSIKCIINSFNCLDECAICTSATWIMNPSYILAVSIVLCFC